MPSNSLIEKQRQESLQINNSIHGMIAEAIMTNGTIVGKLSLRKAPTIYLRPYDATLNRIIKRASKWQLRVRVYTYLLVRKELE